MLGFRVLPSSFLHSNVVVQVGDRLGEYLMAGGSMSGYKWNRVPHSGAWLQPEPPRFGYTVLQELWGRGEGTESGSSFNGTDTRTGHPSTSLVFQPVLEPQLDPSFLKILVWSSVGRLLSFDPPVPRSVIKNLLA